MRKHFRREGANRQRIGQRPSQGQIDFVRELLLEKNEFGKFSDVWIERYLDFVEREIDARDRDSIGRHYHRCALTACAEFQASGKPSDRFSTWLLIQTACRWLVETAGATR
jgi:hypothetical protein